MKPIKDNLTEIQRTYNRCGAKCSRDPQVTLLAVSKTKPVSALEEAIAAGQTRFGENYVRKALKNSVFLRESKSGMALYRPLQSNKSRLVAEHFDWCHTIDRLKIAQRLSDQRPADKAPLNVLIRSISVMRTVNPVSPLRNYRRWRAGCRTAECLSARTDGNTCTGNGS